MKDGKTSLQGVEEQRVSALPLYPINMSSFLALPNCILDEQNIPYQLSPAGYHPTTIVHYALAQWNQYLTTREEQYRRAFLAQAHWLVEQEVSISGDAGGWPIPFPHPDVRGNGSWLSAAAQGGALSVLLRAHQLTSEEIFLQLVQRAVRTFERDILDGGVSAPVGEDGIFFEEAAIYPAAHALSGFIFALFGLYDYQLLAGSAHIEKLIDRSMRTLRDLLDAFDAGFWTYTDLLHKRLASSSELMLQIILLEALADYAGCADCSSTTERWKSYQKHLGSRLRYLITSRCFAARHALWSRARTALFPGQQVSPITRVCVALTAFPVTGGIRAVLVGVAQATTDVWQIEYLTHSVGVNPGDLIVHQFGTKYMASWQFPSVWLYVIAGCRKLLWLMRHGAGYHVILPQDGVFTAAFTALVAKVVGIRVVCVDHGNLTLLKSLAYRAERLQALAAKSWSRPRRLLACLRYMGYWPSLSILAGLAVRVVDHFLLPGVAGDSVEKSCQRLGIHPGRITRFGSMIDIERYVASNPASRAAAREEKGIAPNATVIAMVCRLAPEKGIDIALEALSQALAALSSTQRTLVRVIIAGDGPLRQQVEADISQRALSDTCVLWGETSSEDVISLLGLSDIFLYTSRRGACFSMAVLEAMASACAVIATTEPLSNAHLLSMGRGIALPANDAKQIALALERLINDPPLCRQMGKLARDYIAMYHSPAVFRRTLMRTTYWSGLNELITLQGAGRGQVGAGRGQAVAPTMLRGSLASGSPIVGATACPRPVATALPHSTRDVIRQQSREGAGGTPATQASTANYTNQLRTLIKSSSIYALASLASPLVSLVLAPFLTHHLSAEDYGALAVITTLVALLAGLTQLGLASAFFRSYNYDYESRSDRLAVLSTVVILLSLVSLPVILAIVLTAPWLALFLLKNSSFSAVVRLGALVVLMQNLTVPGFALLRAENRAGLFTALSIINLLVNLGTTLVLVGILRLGIAGSLIGTGSGFAVVALCTLPLILLRAGVHPRFDIAGGLLSFGLPNASNFAAAWVLQLSDRYLLSLFGSLAQTASYAVAYSLGGILSVVVLAPFTLAWPSAAYTIAKRDDAPRVFRLVFRWYSLVLLFAAFALSLASTIILDLFFPSTYRSAAAIIPVIALSTLFYGIYNIFTIGISIKRKTWFVVVFTSVSALVNVGLNLVLIPLYGAMGAAVSTLLAYAILALLAYIVNQRIYPIPFEIGAFSIVLFTGIGFYLGSNFLARGKGTYQAWSISFCALVLYSACLLLLGFLSTRRNNTLSR